LDGMDILGAKAEGKYEVRPGVRQLHPWFRAGAAYLLTTRGACRALQVCTPLRWRLECQLVGHYAAIDFGAKAEKRVFGPCPKLHGYSLEQSVVSTAYSTGGLESARRLTRPHSADGNVSASPITPEEEQRYVDALDAVVAWSMRLTDEPISGFKAIWHPDRQIEGHTGMVPAAMELMNSLAEDPGVRTICEVGFNAGHSSLRWLLHSQARVISFDLGQHHYSKPAAMWLQQRFPTRFEVIWGDSVVEIPKWRAAHPDVRCELIFVDGAHSRDVCRADLLNFAAMANPEYNRVLLDDIFLDNMREVWQELIEEGLVEELSSHEGTLEDGRSYGQVVGRYTGVSAKTS